MTKMKHKGYPGGDELTLLSTDPSCRRGPGGEDGSKRTGKETKHFHRSTRFPLPHDYIHTSSRAVHGNVLISMVAEEWRKRLPHLGHPLSSPAVQTRAHESKHTYARHNNTHTNDSSATIPLRTYFRIQLPIRFDGNA